MMNSSLWTDNIIKMLSRVLKARFLPRFQFSKLEDKDLEKKGPTKDEVKQVLQATEEEDKDDFSKKSNLYIYSFGAIGLLVGYAFMQITSMSYQNKTKPMEMKVTHSGKAQIGGPWKLVTTKGQPISHIDLKGSYYLIYFGFCNCPDICPASLMKLSKALQKIRNSPEGKLISLKTIFVSVDPDRDTPARIERFLSHFDPSIIGVTATANDDPDLKDAMRQFKIYASKIKYEDAAPPPEGKQPQQLYTIDHTIITYLMDDQNNYVTHLGSNLGEFDLARTIVDKILETERNKMRK